MTQLACANPSCAIPRQHATGCTDDRCRGCLPGLAADGLRLCPVHTDRIGHNALSAARLYDDAGLALVTKGEPTRGGVPGGISISEAAVEARTLIRHTFVSWSLLIAEERGIQLPGSWKLRRLPLGTEGPLNRVYVTSESNHALAAYLHTHRIWLAAHGAAGDVSSELEHLARIGYRAAYPDGARIIPIGLCPVEADGIPCGGKIKALLRRADSLLPSAVACDKDEAHSWPADEWRTLGRHMATRRAA